MLKSTQWDTSRVQPPNLRINNSMFIDDYRVLEVVYLGDQPEERESQRNYRLDHGSINSSNYLKVGPIKEYFLKIKIPLGPATKLVKAIETLKTPNTGTNYICLTYGE